MTPYLSIPFLNSFRFVAADVPVDPRFHLVHFDQDLAADSLRPWQVEELYCQKVQYSDRYQLQVHSSQGSAIAGGVVLNLLDCEKRVLFTWNPVAVFAAAGNSYTPPGSNIAIPLTTYHFKFSLGDLPTPPGQVDGKYYLNLSASYDTDVSGSFDRVDQYLSEPFLLGADWPQTLLLEYFSTRNRQGVLFSQVTARFQMRVECDLIDFDPESNDTQYEDQTYNAQLLSSYPYRKFRYLLGGTAGVPDWIRDRVNRIFGCNRLKIDGKPFTKDIGAKWEAIKPPAATLKFAGIDLRESDNNYGSQYLNRLPVVLFSRTGYPYAVLSATMTNGFNTYQVLAAYPVNNSTEEGLMLNFLNGAVATNLGLMGSFAVQGNTVVYLNGDDEYFVPGAATVYTKYLEYDYTLPALSSGTLNIDLNVKSAIGSWGDLGRNGYGDNIGFTSLTATHSYAINAFTQVYKVRMFHNSTDSISSIVVNNTRITAAAGNAPTGLNTYSVIGGYTSFNASMLADCVAALDAVVIRGTNLTTVVGFAQAYQTLASINFSSSALSTAQVDALFNAYRFNAASIPTGGTFAISGQTPAAPPSGSSSVARIYLTVNQSWTLITD